MKREEGQETLGDIIKKLGVPPVAYHPIFVMLTGSVSSALMLGQAIYWSQRTNDPSGWFWKTQEEWTKELSLTVDEQRGARRKLRATGFWIEESRGLPRRWFFRLDFKVLGQALLQLNVEVEKQDFPEVVYHGSDLGKTEVRGSTFPRSTTETTTETTKQQRQHIPTSSSVATATASDVQSQGTATVTTNSAATLNEFHRQQIGGGKKKTTARNKTISEATECLGKSLSHLAWTKQLPTSFTTFRRSYVRALSLAAEDFDAAYSFCAWAWTHCNQSPIPNSWDGNDEGLRRYQQTWLWGNRDKGMVGHWELLYREWQSEQRAKVVQEQEPEPPLPQWLKDTLGKGFKEITVTEGEVAWQAAQLR